MYLLNLLSGLLPAALRPAAKALYPSIGTAVGVGVQWISTGTFDRAELVTAITGGCAALLTYLIPNRPQPAAAGERPPDEDASVLQATDGLVDEPVEPAEDHPDAADLAVREPAPFDEEQEGSR